MATLTASEARARLERMLQYAAVPVLTSDEVTDLFAMVPLMTDAAGVAPGDSGYVATYSPYAAAFREAAATGWEWKAGKVAGNFDAATGSGTKFDRSQVYDMCMRQAANYGGGTGRGATLGSVRVNTIRTERVD